MAVPISKSRTEPVEMLPEELEDKYLEELACALIDAGHKILGEPGGYTRRGQYAGRITHIDGKYVCIGIWYYYRSGWTSRVDGNDTGTTFGSGSVAEFTTPGHMDDYNKTFDVCKGVEEAVSWALSRAGNV